ncbi:MAG: phage tail sheath subtilisin-like domain-containing protein [Gammaproteobacteria bacterium]|nr:phage tail sheath subtilisin-like domain-containing protein [Gammaproteobacteria bacterium]
MPSYATPGVYIQEVSTGSKPISMVGTQTAAFIGVAPDKKANLNKAIACNNWTQFVREFASNAGGDDTHLSMAVFSFFNNGGTRCYIVNNPENETIMGDVAQRSGLCAFEAIDEIAMVAAPGYFDTVSHTALIDHCEKLKDRIAILDSPDEVANIDQLKTVASITSGTKKATEEKNNVGLRPKNTSYAAFYFPWLLIQAPLSRKKKIITAPPSGFMAGIYARTDANRGVHKAPANESVNGALGLSYVVTSGEQGELNTKGVNCIRSFPTTGIKVWGARTLDDGEWKYINVRRLFMMIEESISESTRWVVFEPNDETLWKSIVRDVSAFLTLIWRDGALQGSTPEQAFFVKCDGEINTQAVIDSGRLEIEIGIAPVKPAEFIVFKIGQWAGGTEVETEDSEAESE